MRNRSTFLLIAVALVFAARASAQMWVTTLTSENGGAQTRVSWVTNQFNVGSGNGQFSGFAIDGSESKNVNGLPAFDTLPNPVSYVVNSGLIFNNVTSGGSGAANLITFQKFTMGFTEYSQIVFGTTDTLLTNHPDRIELSGQITGSFVLNVSFSTFNAGSWSSTGQNLQIAPIPEPSTYGLILGGLALAGTAVRRRMKKQAA
jgi:hypothetical protein